MLIVYTQFTNVLQAAYAKNRVPGW